MPTELFRRLEPNQQIDVHPGQAPALALTVVSVDPRNRTIVCQAPSGAVAGQLENTAGVVGVSLPTADGLLRVSAEVQALDPQAGLIRLRVLGHSIRVQRREFYRLENPDAKVRMRVRDASGRWGQRVQAQARNLSGDGIALVVAVGELERGTHVHVELDLSGERLSTGGRIIQTALHVPHPGKATLRIQFADVEEQDRARIIRYIFRVQARRGA